MRYLLLSVLVVCMIGVMIPSVFAEVESSSDYGTVKTEKSQYEIEPQWGKPDLSVKIFGSVPISGSCGWVYFEIFNPDGSKDSTKVRCTSDGYYENFIIVDYNDARGTYKVDVTFRDNYVGGLTFEVIEKSAKTTEKNESSSSSTSTSTQPKSSANNLSSEVESVAFIPTVLTLDPVPSTFYIGERITFSGTLARESGTPVTHPSDMRIVFGEPVGLYTTEPKGFEMKFEDGTFSWDWSSDECVQMWKSRECQYLNDISEEKFTLSLFAQYDGNKVMKPSTSQVYTVEMKKYYGELVDKNENLSINKITIHSKDKKDLLVLSVTVIPERTKTLTSNPLHSLYSLNLESMFPDENFENLNVIYPGVLTGQGDWTELNNILTEDVEIFGNTVKGSTEWSVNCPSYVGQPVNANVPKDLTLCYEISKKMNQFYLEGIVFSRNAVDQDPISSLIESNSSSSEDGGCLIATAAFGSEMAPQVQLLREIRDNVVLQTESGTNFMAGFNQFYYSFSPAVADYERENPVFKEAIKITLTPLLTSLTLLQYTDIDSESEMLGYGIGVILLNIGMYFVAPAVVIMVVRKRI